MTVAEPILPKILPDISGEISENQSLQNNIIFNSIVPIMEITNEIIAFTTEGQCYENTEYW